MRPAVVAVALLLAGCGFMQVGERPMPSIAGSVAATAWQSQEPTVPGLGADAAAAATTPEAFLELLVRSVMSPEQLSRDVDYGVLGRSGDEATAYLQLTDSPGFSRPVLAFEAYLTLRRAADGTWSLRAVQTREQCAEPLVGGFCDDRSQERAPAEPVPAPSVP